MVLPFPAPRGLRAPRGPVLVPPVPLPGILSPLVLVRRRAVPHRGRAGFWGTVLCRALSAPGTAPRALAPPGGRGGPGPTAAPTAELRAAPWGWGRAGGSGRLGLMQFLPWQVVLPSSCGSGRRGIVVLLLLCSIPRGCCRLPRCVRILLALLMLQVHPGGEFRGLLWGSRGCAQLFPCPFCFAASLRGCECSPETSLWISCHPVAPGG